MTTAAAYTASRDLSQVEALTDAQLAIELAAAKTRFAAARVNDPRRSSLGYSDAKLAVDVLAGETRRRITISVTMSAPAVHDTVCGPQCLNASTPAHECGHGPCAQHGAARHSTFASTPATQAATWARLPVVDDEPF